MYRTPVEIQRSVETDDGYGGRRKAWERDFTWFCRVLGVRGTEAEVHGRLASVETHVLEGRYDPRITSAHRVLLDGRQLNIRTAQDRKGTKVRTTLECTEGTDA